MKRKRGAGIVERQIGPRACFLAWERLKHCKGEVKENSRDQGEKAKDIPTFGNGVGWVLVGLTVAMREIRRWMESLRQQVLRRRVKANMLYL